MPPQHTVDTCTGAIQDPPPTKAHRPQPEEGASPPRRRPAEGAGARPGPRDSWGALQRATLTPGLRKLSKVDSWLLGHT